jgi:DNA-binding transcriptional LysR family regulator
MFRTAKPQIPESLVETGSMALLSRLVGTSEHLGYIPARQVARDVAQGALVQLPFQPTGTLRPIGLTKRTDRRPMQAQSDMLAALRAVAA